VGYPINNDSLNAPSIILGGAFLANHGMSEGKNSSRKHRLLPCGRSPRRASAALRVVTAVAHSRTLPFIHSLGEAAGAEEVGKADRQQIDSASLRIIQGKTISFFQLLLKKGNDLWPS